MNYACKVFAGVTMRDYVPGYVKVEATLIGMNCEGIKTCPDGGAFP